MSQKVKELIQADVASGSSGVLATAGINIDANTIKAAKEGIYAVFFFGFPQFRYIIQKQKLHWGLLLPN